jgi:putative hydrolase of the HAD superfamily
MTRPSAFGAIFFDAVGTLIYPDPPAAEVYSAVGRRHGSRLTVTEIVARFRKAFARQEQLDRQQGLQTSETREIERWQQIVAGVLTDVDDTQKCFEELFQHFSRPTAWRPNAEVGVLERLARQGRVLGTASNYDSRLRSVVAGLPALHAIRHLVISSEIGWRKPARPFFESLCRTVDLPAGQILLVGDDLENDYHGARAAGVHALLVGSAETRNLTPTEWIERLGDLEQWLRF